MSSCRIAKQMARNSVQSSTQLQCHILLVSLLLEVLPSQMHPRSRLPVFPKEFTVHKHKATLFMSVWPISQNRDITFKREFQEASHVHVTLQSPFTDTLSNLGGSLLIHINDMPVALTVIHNLDGNGLHTPFHSPWGANT